MNTPVNPLILLSAVVIAALLAVWLLARRRRARNIVERMSDQLAATAGRGPGHVSHPALVVSPTSVLSGTSDGVGTPFMSVAPGRVDTLETIAGTEQLDTIVGGGPRPEPDRVEAPTEGSVITSPGELRTNDGPRTLTDMLEGIKLPYDLMPVMTVVEDPDRHIIFLTTHSNAGEVGKRFADELEQLGFELESVEFDQAVAVRGDDVISMKIVPSADKVEVGGSPRYGAAGSGDVALETWIGRAPVPPSAP